MGESSRDTLDKKARVFAIVNHAAARARGAWPRVRDALTRADVEFDAHESLKPGETEEKTRAALVEGYGTIAVVGGDGTLSAAAAGYFEPLARLSMEETPRAVSPDAALAIVPAGTGDDFARGLAGGRRLPLEAWAERLIRHCQNMKATTRTAAETTTRTVDVVHGSADGGARRFVCVNAATLGVGAEVARRVASQGSAVRRLSGEARFAWAAVQSLAAWRVRRACVHVDGAAWVEGELNLVVVANGPTAGGGMNFAPAASAADGLLDVLTVCGISRAGLLRELARVRTGRHLNNTKVKLTRATRVRVETADASAALAIEADGDVRGHTPAEFRLMAGALRVVC